MKPFLGIDRTFDKRNQQKNGECFLIQKPIEVLEKHLNNSTEKADKLIKKSQIPLFFRIIQGIAGLSGLMLVSGILGADVSLKEAYGNAPWMFFVALICVVVWFVLWFWGKSKEISISKTDECEQTVANLESVIKAIRNDLAVPREAKKVDVLSLLYKIKNGQVKFWTDTENESPEFELFADKEYLYLANITGKYAFPLSSLVKIHQVKEKVLINPWNKEERYDSEMYKQYKMSETAFGVYCPSCFMLEVHYEDDVYGIYFPSYELNSFEEATGLKFE